MPSATLDAVLEHATRLRRDLHRIPELGYQENQTAELIRAELSRLRIDYAAGPNNAPTATVAMIGDASKPCVLLRADIDALPITEANDVAYVSTTPGRMHACGHDGHTANLLAVAAMLQAEARELPACVKLVWQPAEEGGGGGRRLVEAGLMADTPQFGPKVAAAFGLHGWPTLPLGRVSTRHGPIMAATDTFEVVVKGKGGHAAFPHFTHDPVAATAYAIVNLQQFVSRQMDPTDSAVLSVTRLSAGTANNIIPDKATFGGTARTLTPTSRAAIKKAIEHRSRLAAEGGGCEIKFTWNAGYPPTVNDPAMADYVMHTALRVLGPDGFIPAAKPSMGGEDFAYYLEKVPGCFFLIGLLPPGRDDYPALHTETFDFTDAAMETGVRMMLELVRGFESTGARGE